MIPIAKNRAWFFGAYQPAITPMTRTVTPRGTTTPVSVDRKDQVQYLTANQTAQLSDTLRSKIAFNLRRRSSVNSIASLKASDGFAIGVKL